MATLAFVSLVVAAVLGTSAQIGPRIDRAVGRIEPTLLPTPPSPPQNLAAVGGDGQVSLTWDPPQDDGGSPLLAYLVYRGDSPGGESLLAGVGLVTSWIDITVTNGHTYYYEVVATNLIGNSDPSNEASATPGPPPTPPDPPQGLTATAGDGTVDLAWSAPGSDGGSPITNYKVYRGTSSNGESFLTELGDVLSFSDSGLTNGQTYYYYVTAVNSIGDSGPSNEASATPNAPATPPGAPQSLTATAGDAAVVLTWSPPSSDGGSPITNYKVYRGTSHNGETFLADAGPVLAYTDTSVTNGQTYYYEVTAENSVGEGPRSNEVSATPNAPATPPTEPQNLAATPGDGHVDLTWDAPANDGGLPILEYRVYRGTSSGGESFLASAGLSLTFTDSSVTNGQTYYYQVTARNAVGVGPPSNEASATPNPPATPPGAPSGLSATAGDGSVSLSWSAPGSDGGSPITNYKIYRGGSSNGETLLDTVGDVLSYTDTSVTNGNTYYYKVAAVNSVGDGPLSNEASATPAAPHTAPGAPRDLVATAGDASVSLSWSPPSSDGGAPITNYKIYRGTVAGGQLSLIATVPNVLSYTDSPLTNGKTYYYKVTAVNEVGEGPPSNEASATPVSGDTAPSPPRSLSAAAGDARVALGWLAPSSDGGSPITNYKIYRGTSSNGESLLITVGNVSTYTDTGVSNGVTYYYVVTAVNGIGDSGASGEASATPTAGPTAPDAPQGLHASPGSGRVDLTWSAPGFDGGSPITGYRLYRGTNSNNRSYSVDVGDVLSYPDTGLTNGQRYYYVVTAINAVGEGLPSSEASARPATYPDAPQKLQAIAGNRLVTLQWSGPGFDGGAPVTGYKIYRGTTSGSTTFLATVGGGNDSYADGGLTNGQAYYYRISAVNRVGEGGLSAEVSTTPSSGPAVPAAPQNLVATAGNRAVTLRWSAPASDGGSPVENYTIYRGTSPSNLAVLIAGSKSLSLFDGGVTNGVTYYYAVAAVNAVGTGPRSPPISATPKGSSSGPDTTSPTIAIVSPGPGALVAPGPLNVSGTASDDVGLAWVEVSADGRNWTLATLGTASWNAILNLTVGPRTIYARAMDGSGNSADANVTVTVSPDAGTNAAGGDPSRSLIATAVISFAIAAAGAWFVLDRRRREGGPRPVMSKRPPDDPLAGAGENPEVKSPVATVTTQQRVVVAPPTAEKRQASRDSPPKIMGRWRK